MAEEKAAEPAPNVGKGNTILIIVIAVLGTLLIGGGIGGFMLYRSASSHAAAAAEDEEAASEDAPSKAEGKKSDKKADAKKGKKGEPKTPPIYVPLEPPFVVNFDPKQNVRFLQITVEVMSRDAATANMVKENNPQVRNDLLMLFGGQDPAKLQDREGKETLRKDALETVRKLVKDEGGKPELLEAVYFTTFVMQ